MRKSLSDLPAQRVHRRISVQPEGAPQATEAWRQPEPRRSGRRRCASAPERLNVRIIGQLCDVESVLAARSTDSIQVRRAHDSQAVHGRVAISGCPGREEPAFVVEVPKALRWSGAMAGRVRKQAP